ncbi:GGDEF domain-containing protein [Oribacterium sp. WCC10]|uniref:GGDEF domain-containing protein n=1 Tax=Oribacterium sp. WCC10 TaxID=1855343 RepID=UPI0008DEC43F|nr:GGDEF domain-containing protein [Oribacterium sp. WCC10]SFG62165.1 diguanylate cyclase (GGDEF) domain-containing protein [Oribacterium sp. WCC10]
MSKIANYDPLTGVKNKHAYIDAEAKLNSLIEENESPDFAIIVFDLNGLKTINDTLGHQAGDQFIKDGCSLICDYFKHSPVYRIGGDEFVAIAQDHDYLHLDEIMNYSKLNTFHNHLEKFPFYYEK